MSEENTPSADQIREARRQGFGDSIGHMPEDRQTRLATSYVAQDDRRESNINGLRSQVLGSE